MASNSIRPLRIIAGLVLACGFTASAAAQEVTGSATTTARPMSANLANVTQAMLDGAGSDSKNWLHSNGSYEQTRYYAGKQINAKNVGRLKPAFVFQTAVLESMETAPIVDNGVMFLTTSFNHVYAIDARTGEEYWHYKHKLGPIVTVCCGNNNRGVAIAEGKLYMGTIDAKLAMNTSHCEFGSRLNRLPATTPSPSSNSATEMPSSTESMLAMTIAEARIAAS
jgi:glucose dehydrogenase